MKTTTDIYAWVGVNADGENVLSIEKDGKYYPLISDDLKMMSQMKKLATDAGRELDVPVRLVRFTGREDIET